MVFEEETQQKLEISSEKTTRNGKFPFHTSEVIGNCAFPLSFNGENSHEILIFFAVVGVKFRAKCQICFHLLLVIHHDNSL